MTAPIQRQNICSALSRSGGLLKCLSCPGNVILLSSFGHFSHCIVIVPCTLCSVWVTVSWVAHNRWTVDTLPAFSVHSCRVSAAPGVNTCIHCPSPVYPGIIAPLAQLDCSHENSPAVAIMSAPYRQQSISLNTLSDHSKDLDNNSFDDLNSLMDEKSKLIPETYKNR